MERVEDKPRQDEVVRPATVRRHLRVGLPDVVDLWKQGQADAVGDGDAQSRNSQISGSTMKPVVPAFFTT